MNLLVHFSIDDIIGCFLWLTRNKCGSIFDSYVFGFSKELYEKYGIHTTCNCMYTDGHFTLKDVSDRWLSEFRQHSSWLKFAFHCYGPDSDYRESSYDQMEREYRLVAEELMRITGGEISSIVRTHLFSGSRDAVEALADNGVKVLLTADDDRGSYDLYPKDELKARADFCETKDKKLIYINTNMRLESIKNVELFINGLEKSNKKRLVLFTHEYCLADLGIRKRAADIFDYYKNRGTRFDNMTSDFIDWHRDKL